MILSYEAVFAELNNARVVIPGHGPIASTSDVRDYIDMLKSVRMRISSMIDERKSLEQVAASHPFFDFDEKYGPEANSLGFVNRVYFSLKAAY